MRARRTKKILLKKKTEESMERITFSGKERIKTCSLILEKKNSAGRRENLPSRD